MDIRIEKTDRAIEKAFLELRSKMPLEKIKIKDLCTLACVNKSTFYAHYEDIYALSSRLEDKLIADILASVSAVELHPVRTEALTRELFRAFVQNKTAVNILFADSRQGIFANRIEKGLRERLTAQDPTFANDPKRGILLSFCGKYPEMAKELETAYFEWADKSDVLYFQKMWNTYNKNRRKDFKEYKTR